jgi:protoporphyrinogen oxidase
LQPAEARMKVHVIGGGPAGLYYAILMKKAWPQTQITVFERNRPDDTFGFGVVFSDQTADRSDSYEQSGSHSFESLTRNTFVPIASASSLGPSVLQRRCHGDL